MSWPVSRLDHLASSCLGKMLDKQKNRGTPRPYLRNINVRWGSFDLTDVQEMLFEEDELERYTVQRGDVVVCEGGEPGRCAVWMQSVPMYIQKALHRVRCGPALLPTFLAYWLRHLASSEILARHFSGTTIQHLPGVRLAALDVPHPPVREQERVVAAIETQFSRLDAAVASLTRAKANVKRARASVLKAAVEGRLVPTEAALARAEGRDYEPASVLLERIIAERKAAWTASGARGKYKEPVKPETDGLPTLPAGWCWGTPGQLGSGVPYDLAIGPFGSNLKVPDYRDAGTPLVFVRNVRAECFSGLNDKFIDHEKAEELGAHRVRAGDIVITKMGEPPGDAALYPIGGPDGIVTADVIKWTTAESLSAWFFVYATRASVVRSQVVAVTQGVAQKKISLERFLRVAYPLPPRAEQHRIVAEVDRRLSVLDAVNATLDANLARCARLRQSILKRAFEGRLVPAKATAAPVADVAVLAAESAP